MNAEAILKLKVAESHQQDVGKGIVRVSNENMQELQLQQGQLIQIQGKKPTAAIVMPPHPTDEGLNIIRMDGLIRSNSGLSIGELAELSQGRFKPAKKVVLAPAKEGLQLSGSGDALRLRLMQRPMTAGDLISITAYHRPNAGFNGEMFGDNFFQNLFEAPTYALMEIRVLVVSASPRGLVYIDKNTEIVLQPNHVKSSDGQVTEVTYEDLGGMKKVIQKVREMIELPLKKPELFARLGIEAPKGIILEGPPGTGKTLLAKAVANESDAYFTSINGPEIMGKHYGESEERLRKVFEDAEKNSPAIVFIDEIDSIAPKRSDVSGETERRIVAQLLTLMDGLKSRGNLMVIAATNRIDSIDPALRRPGRFDREIEVGIPDYDGRLEVTQIHTRGMPLHPDVHLEEIAQLTHGFTGSDIAALARESALICLRKILPEIDLEEEVIPNEVLEKLIVTKQDFNEALKEVQPSALREIMIEVPKVYWSDVGGAEDIKRSLKEMVELPLTHPESFKNLGIQPPKGLLLYGPPGTGKTLLAKAVATEAQANFLSAKGSDLLSKWYGESEQRIHEFFRKARQVAPAVIFFDELDSLASVRGGNLGDSSANERVVNQLLSEIDGMEELRGVVLIAATNRPDQIDPALLRPGRFDEMVYVGVPDLENRKEILESILSKVNIAKNVDVQKIAELTQRFTGADLAAVCKKAGLLAIRDNLQVDVISMKYFKQALEDVTPSVTESTEDEYKKLAKKVKQDAARVGFAL